MIFSTNKNDRRDITKILLNVALNDNNNLKKINIAKFWERFTKPVVIYSIDPINPKPFENRVLVIIIVIRMFQCYTITASELSLVYYTPPHKQKLKVICRRLSSVYNDFN